MSNQMKIFCRLRRQNLDQDAVIEWLEVLDIVCVEHAHDVLLLEDDVAGAVEVDLSPRIL